MHFAHFFNENKLYSVICFGCENLEYIMIALCKKEICASTWQKALSYKLGLFIFPRPKMQKRWKNWMNRKKFHKKLHFSIRVSKFFMLFKLVSSFWEKKLLNNPPMGGKQSISLLKALNYVDDWTCFQSKFQSRKRKERMISFLRNCRPLIFYYKSNRQSLASIRCQKLCCKILKVLHTKKGKHILLN
jgi:hypothetical protein